jgi:cytochrome c oxidase cbb3-type subunit 2
MNRAPFLFLGIFLALALSFVGLVQTNQISYGAFLPHVDEGEGKAFPLQAPGLAAQGKLVYQDLGCVSCHTQQVRREGFGSDVGEKSRGWGERQSVARDYLRESRVLLGSQRIGPDLRNFAARKNADGTEHTAAGLYAYLYHPQAVVKTSNMPAYPWLEKDLVDADALPRHLSALRTVGVPYTDDEIAGAADAVRGKSELTALIAYLQSLGRALK